MLLCWLIDSKVLETEAQVHMSVVPPLPSFFFAVVNDCSRCLYLGPLGAVHQCKSSRHAVYLPTGGCLHSFLSAHVSPFREVETYVHYVKQAWTWTPDLHPLNKLPSLSAWRKLLFLDPFLCCCFLFSLFKVKLMKSFTHFYHRSSPSPS